jgi:hypothetical protein
MFPLFDEPSLGLDLLKFKGLLVIKDVGMPSEIKLKIRDLLLNDNLTRSEYLIQYHNLTQAYYYRNWKLRLFLKKFKYVFFEVVVAFPWVKISMGVASFFLIVFVLNKINFKKLFKRKLNKRVKKVFAIIFNIIERFCALWAYFVPLLNIYTAYVPGLLATFPYLHFLLPDAMQDAMDFYVRRPWVINYIYFFTTMYGVTLFKLPKPRFIRFHLLRGLMLLALQGIPDAVFKTFQSAETLTQSQVVTTTLSLFAINLSWLLPCIYQAITYTYPRSSFIRDAVEINLGRDKDEGFKWWDRRK